MKIRRPGITFRYRGPCFTTQGSRKCEHRRRMHNIWGGPCRFVGPDGKGCPAHCQTFTGP